MRVLLFFVYFFGLAIAVPGLVVGLVQAKYGLIDGPPLASTSPWAVQDGHFVNGKSVFATSAPAIDMRSQFPFAQAAALAVDTDGTIAYAISAPGDVERAAATITGFYGVKIPAAVAEARIGPENFWYGRVRGDERLLLVVLGSDEAVVERRFAAMSGLPTAAGSAIEAFGQRIKQITKYGVFTWAAMQFYFFGRIASWAAGEPAASGVAPVAAETLMRRLLALNDQDLPYTMSRGARANEILIDWRYADAKWLDLMRIHGMRYAYRLVLRLDEDKHNARAQDRYAFFDWSVGRGPNLASFKWKASSGITFYEYKYERVFGLQFRDGKPTFDLSYAYTFDLNELKQPVIEIIRNAGWNFRPVLTFFRPIGG